MGAGTGFKWMYAALAVAVVVIGFQLLRPTTTRNEEELASVAPDSGTGIQLPEHPLQVPPALQAIAGGGMDPGHGYWYLPYAVLDEEQGIAMVQALRAELLRGHGFPARLTVPEGRGAGGGDTLFPTESGVARFYTSDINNPAETGASESSIPMIITQPHPGDYASDVLFLDGHLESVPVGRFPLSKRFLEALSALDPPAHTEKGAGKH